MKQKFYICKHCGNIVAVTFVIITLGYLNVLLAWSLLRLLTFTSHLLALFGTLTVTCHLWTYRFKEGLKQHLLVRIGEVFLLAIDDVVENVLEHHMHSEHYELPAETAELINKTKANGGRVFAVGTTCCRTLESVATFRGEIREDDGWTNIFIYPGYEFKCIDCLITNFHLPESTLIMLVSAFCGYENTMNAYKIAVEEKYRFFSFGDSCVFYGE